MGESSTTESEKYFEDDDVYFCFFSLKELLYSKVLQFFRKRISKTSYCIADSFVWVLSYTFTFV